jgi:hypothetical protein
MRTRFASLMSALLLCHTAAADDPALLHVTPALNAQISTPLANALSSALGRPVRLLDQPPPTAAGVRVLAEHDVRSEGQATAGLVALAPMVLVARSSLAVLEGAELVDILKSRSSDALRLAHDGPGSASEQCASLLAAQLGAGVIVVARAPLAAFEQNQADLACLSAAEAVPLARSGKVTAHVVAAEERLPALWDVATGPELGLALFTTTTWYGLYVATAAEASKAHAGLQAFLASEANLQAMAELGLSPFPMTHRSIDAHRAFADTTR